MEETKLISLNSSNATYKNNSYYLSDVEFFFPNLLTSDNTVNKIELSLLHAEIPVSFYTINYSNSFFKFKIDVDPVQNLQLPVGNYNANSLITALNTLINDNNFIITISKITGKLTFQHNKPFIIYTDNNYSIGKILGFNLGLSYSSSATNPYTLSTPFPLNLLGIKKINIESTELYTNNVSSYNSSTLSLIQSLPVDQPSYGLIVYENKTGIKNLLKIRDINKIDIKLTDEDHNLINFNNVDWTILFSLTITRQIIDVKIEPQKEIKKPIENSPDIKTKNILNDLDFLQTK